MLELKSGYTDGGSADVYVHDADSNIYLPLILLMDISNKVLKLYLKLNGDVTVDDLGGSGPTVDVLITKTGGSGLTVDYLKSQEVLQTRWNWCNCNQMEIDIFDRF